MAFSSVGNLVVASRLNNDLVEYDGVGGGFVRGFFDACPTSLAVPFDLISGADGNIYVSCPASSGVHRFDGVTGFPLGFFVFGGAGGLVTPRGLAFGPNGNLFVASFSGEVLEYDGATGAFIGVFVDVTGNGGGAMYPYGLAVSRREILRPPSRFLIEVAGVPTAVTGGFSSRFSVPFGRPGGSEGPTKPDLRTRTATSM